MTLRLLVLTPRFPYPLYGGDVLRIYQLCEALRGTFRMTLVSICQTRAEMNVRLPQDCPFGDVHRVYLPRWRSYANVFKAIFSGRSMQTAYYASREFARVVAELREGHDVMLCHLIRTAPYADGFKGTKVLELTDFIPLTYARSNALKDKWFSVRRMIYTLEQRRVDKAQNQLARQFDLTTFVSDVDRQMFLDSSGLPPEKVATFGNGVNLSERPFNGDRRGKTMAFIGTLMAMPNADAVSHFVTAVLPIIRREEPTARLRVVGAVPDSFKARFESSFVYFTGPVVDLAKAVEDCVLGVCPVRIGAGIQNKMLDYMALGMAAVTTGVGAEGFEKLNGHAFVVSDGPEEMAATILSLLNDGGRRRELASQGRQMVEANYSWSGRLSDLPSRILKSRHI